MSTEESERDGKFRVEQKAVLTEEKGGNTAPFILSENAPVIEGWLLLRRVAEMPRYRRHCIRRQRHFAMCQRIKLQFCR